MSSFFNLYVNIFSKAATISIVLVKSLHDRVKYSYTFIILFIYFIISLFLISLFLVRRITN
jgi:hypothetical protein